MKNNTEDNNYNPTKRMFSIGFMLSIPIQFFLFFIIAMGAAEKTTGLSFYIAEDVQQLIGLFFAPIIALLIPHALIMFIMIFTDGSSKSNFKKYVALVLMNALPYSFILVGIHGDSSAYTRDEKIKKAQIKEGLIVPGTDIHSLLSRYLEVSNIKHVKDIVEQDKFMFSPEYMCISYYLDNIRYSDEKDSIKKANSLFEKEFPDIDVEITSTVLSYLDMVKEFTSSEITLDEIHKKVQEFMGKKINHHESRIDVSCDELVYYIINYESINILKNNEISGDNDSLLRENLIESRKRLYLSSEKEWYRCEIEDKNTERTILESSEIFKEYYDLISNLLNESYLTKSKISASIKDFSEKHSLDLENDNLEKLQVLLEELEEEEEEEEEEEFY